MKKIKAQEWRPSDGLILEDNALLIAKSNFNSLVVAGPGAGKTELLAQRASYLLQTNTCIYPRKILAISFKADAATNLGERVQLRCGEKLSRRFDSMTFDAFSKGIFDRFQNALPEKFKVTKGYSIALSDSPVLDEFKFRNSDVFHRNKPARLTDFFYNPSLPYSVDKPLEILKDAIWMSMIKAEKPLLPFKLIMRLSELIINSNPVIKSYLQKTYSHIFLDEFQDTTTIQYQFLSSCFFGSKSVVTAVGDDKQRIMIWAGARASAFKDLQQDIGARQIPLFMNFRSAPRLVALQNFLIEHLMKKQDVATASTKWAATDGECKILLYKSQEQETAHLFSMVKQWTEVDGISPREICILVKQLPAVYGKDIISYFNEHGIKTRDETEIQGILAEPVVEYLLKMISSTFDKSAAQEAIDIFDFIGNLHGLKTAEDLLSLEKKLSSFRKKLYSIAKEASLSNLKSNLLIDEIISFAGVKNIIANFPTYADEPFFEYLIKDLKTRIVQELKKGINLIQAIESIIGKDTIPVMTVHKSKGLEYHTTVFVGLEDKAFWSYQTQADEDRCTFFVALSRAKNRIFFTFSEFRKDKFNRVNSQTLSDISDIIDVLENSGLVDIIDIVD